MRNRYSISNVSVARRRRALPLSQKSIISSADKKNKEDTASKLSDDAEMRSMVIHHRWRFCNAQHRQRACSK